MKLVKSANGKHEAHPGDSVMGLWNNFFSSPFSNAGLPQAWPDRPRIKAPVVGNNVEWAKAQANYKDGVLTVRIPKAADVKPNKIDIK